MISYIKKQYIAAAVIVSIATQLISPVYAEGANLTNINNFSVGSNAQLALAVPDSRVCTVVECETNQSFDQRVQQIGQNLATTAYALFPNLQQRVPEFRFEIAEKAQAGSDSDATGNIVLLRGVQDLALNDEALSFVLAREMGHTIAKHHRKNYSTRLLISTVVSLVFPVAGILSFSSTASQAASSATSYVGSQVALDSVQASQHAEADAVANSLLESQNISFHLLADGLPRLEPHSNDWLNELQISKDNLQLRLKMRDASLVSARN